MFTQLFLALSTVITAQNLEPSQDNLRDYETAKAKVGRNADHHLKLALWCEAHGLHPEKLKHLALAVLIQPQNPKARALMGLIAFQGRWERPDVVGQKVQADALFAQKLAEYNDRRARTPHTADAHWKLALWCDDNGLKPEAIAHFTTVVRIDPKRDAAWKRLGYKQDKGRWVTDNQIAAGRVEAETQKLADVRWRKQLEALSIRLNNPTTKARAINALAEITDPRAVPAIWSTFVSSRNPKSALAVQLLGQIDSLPASRALVYLALASSSSDVRRAAVETLKRRDPREFAGLLIAMIREPIKYEARSVKGPGADGTLLVQGKDVDVKRRYVAPSLPNVQLGPNDILTYDANGLPVIDRLLSPPVESHIHIENFSPFYVAQPTPSEISQNIVSFQNTLAHSPLGKQGKAIGQILANHPPGVSPVPPGVAMAQEASMYGRTPVEAAFFGDLALANQGLLGSPNDPIRNFYVTTAPVAMIPVGQMTAEAQRTAVEAQQKLQEDVATLDQANAQTTKRNAPALEILKESTGQDFGPDRQAWSKWLADAQGYAFISNQSDSRPTVFEEVTPASQPVPVILDNLVIGFQAISCFGAGTEVHTLTGRKPIETLRAGDRVLTWNTNTGSLAIQPILTVYHNPPSKTLNVQFEHDSIITTPWHRFWCAGKGWVVARDLKPGDVVRTLQEPATIVAITPEDTRPVFNLEVAEDHNFLVGRTGALVHDNTVASAITEPFDAAPASTTVTASP